MVLGRPPRFVVWLCADLINNLCSIATLSMEDSPAALTGSRAFLFTPNEFIAMCGFLIAGAGPCVTAATGVKPYYLQRGKDEREFIDDKLHKGSEQINVVYAASWKQAKELFINGAHS